MPDSPHVEYLSAHIGSLRGAGQVPYTLDAEYISLYIKGV